MKCNPMKCNKMRYVCTLSYQETTHHSVSYSTYILNKCSKMRLLLLLEHHAKSDINKKFWTCDSKVTYFFISPLLLVLLLKYQKFLKGNIYKNKLYSNFGGEFDIFITTNSHTQTRNVFLTSNIHSNSRNLYVSVSNATLFLIIKYPPVGE